MSVCDINLIPWALLFDSLTFLISILHNPPFMILHIPWMPFLDDAQRWISLSTFISPLHDLHIFLGSSALLFFQLLGYPLFLLLVCMGFFGYILTAGWCFDQPGLVSWVSWMDIIKIVFAFSFVNPSGCITERLPVILES